MLVGVRGFEPPALPPEAVPPLISCTQLWPNAWCQQNSGGDLRRPLHEVAGADPEALEAAQGGIGALEILRGKPSRQHLGMALMHRRQAVPQADPLLGEPDVNHASIM